MITLIMAVEAAHAGQWLLELLSTLGTPNVSRNGGKWQIENDEGWLSVRSAEDVRREYELEEYLDVTAILGEPALYAIEGRPERLVASYIRLLPDNLNILIDNQYGWTAPAKAYKDAIARRSEWLYTPDGIIRRTE